MKKSRIISREEYRDKYDLKDLEDMSSHLKKLLGLLSMSSESYGKYQTDLDNVEWAILNFKFDPIDFTSLSTKELEIINSISSTKIGQEGNIAIELFLPEVQPVVISLIEKGVLKRLPKIFPNLSRIGLSDREYPSDLGSILKGRDRS